MAVIGVAEVLAMAVRAASAGVVARARIATRTERLRSVLVDAGVNRNSLLRVEPRRARVAASRGSETAGVKEPIVRALSEGAGRALVRCWVEAASAGASRSATAISDALPAAPMDRSFLKTYDSKSSRDLVRLARHRQRSGPCHPRNHFGCCKFHTTNLDRR